MDFKLEHDDLLGIRYDSAGQMVSSDESVAVIGGDEDKETLIHAYIDRDRTIHLRTVNEVGATKPTIVAISPVNMNDNTIPTIKRFNANLTSGCQSHFDGLKSWEYKDSYFLFCDHEYPAAATTQAHAQIVTIASTLSDTSTTTVKRYAKNDESVSSFWCFQPVGGHLSGQNAFAAITGGDYIKSISLMGPSAGTPQSSVSVDGVCGYERIDGTLSSSE
ncbi:hypothetical protein BG015_009129 [Linnemannia schmuckeri]|uniref:Uncharacterized protein n=1 Tax=Linnemannia schmuckeri TaxID=64567 RepID=A0A9P5RVY9_9FUNG|nr:hypothetical protein BG015_009129 [Linnemannia schmuckeri]